MRGSYKAGHMQTCMETWELSTLHASTASLTLDIQDFISLPHTNHQVVAAVVVAAVVVAEVI